MNGLTDTDRQTEGQPVKAGLEVVSMQITIRFSPSSHSQIRGGFASCEKSIDLGKRFYASNNKLNLFEFYLDSNILKIAFENWTF